MTRAELIQFINANIYPNGRNQITAPMVRDSILAVVGFLGDAAVKDIGAVLENNTDLVTGGAVYDAIRAYLSSVMKMVGETTTDVITNPTANPVYVDGEPHAAQKGDVVVYGYKEFWWTGSLWKELGDEASWALKTITITGTGDLAGGGSLEANRTLDLTQSAKDKLAHGETAFSWLERYSTNRLRLKSPYSYLNARKGLILEEETDYSTTPADFVKQVVTFGETEYTILRSKLPIVSDSFISAGGISPGGGGASAGNATLVAQTYGGTLSATGIEPINFYSKERVDQLLLTAGTVQTVAGVAPTNGDIPVASLKSALGLGAAAAYGIGSVASGNTGLVTGGSVYSAINEASWALKTTSISAGTGLEGGGTLAANRTISISPTYQTYISNGNTAYGWGNHADAGYLLATTAASTYATITALNVVSGRVTTLEGRTNWDTYFGVDENGDIYVKKNGNTARGFYSYGFVSAGGVSSGGGTAGADLPAVWTSLRNVSTSASEINETIKIAEAHIPDMASTYGYLKSGDVSGVYLPLTGGTLTGALQLLAGILFYDNTTYCGYLTSNSPGVLYWNDTTTWRTVYHSGNFVAGTNYVAPSALNNYLPLSAGSSYPLTGDLYIYDSASKNSGVGIMNDTVNGVRRSLIVLDPTIGDRPGTGGDYFYITCNSDGRTYFTGPTHIGTGIVNNNIVFTSLNGCFTFGPYENSEQSTYKVGVVGSFNATTIYQNGVALGSNAFSSTAYLPLAGGTMSNTNVVTNLDADLLDGLHASGFLRNYGLNPYTYSSEISSQGTCTLDTGYPETPDNSYNTSYLTLGEYSAPRLKQLAFCYDTDNIYYRRDVGNGWTSWVKLWNSSNSNNFNANWDAKGLRVGGQDGYHDGYGLEIYYTNDDAIGSGGVSVVQSYGRGAAYGDNFYPLRISGSKIVLTQGNVGIGTTSPAYTLDVNGSLNATTIYQNGVALGDRAFDSTSYLPLTGGVISGSEGALKIKTTAGTAWCGFEMRDSSDNSLGYYVSRVGEGQPYWLLAGHVNAYKIWHAGNDGANSGLDADLLDGYHADGFAKQESAYGVSADSASDGFIGGKLYNASDWHYPYYAFLSAGYNNYKMQFNAVNNSLYFRAGDESGLSNKPFLNVITSANIGSQSVRSASYMSTPSWSGSDNINCLQTAFANGYITRNVGMSAYLSHGSASMAFGWMLDGYDSAPYGGWFISNYGTPTFVGITNGNWYEAEIYTAQNSNRSDVAWNCSTLTMNGSISGVTNIYASGDIYSSGGLYATGNVTVNSPDWDYSYGFHINEGGSSSYGFDIMYGANDAFAISRRNGSTSRTNIVEMYRDSNDTRFYGNVGIGVLPSYAFDVNGVIHATTGILSDGYITAGSASSREFKDNVQSMSLEYARNIIMSSRPITFQWNALAHSLCDKYEGDGIGFIAQEAEQLMPFAVSPIFEKYKRLDYTAYISPLVRVAQSHETRIRQLERENAELKRRLNMN